MPDVPKKGGNIKVKQQQPRSLPWTSGVWCQRLFRSRAASSWFEVQAVGEVQISIIPNGSIVYPGGEEEHDNTAAILAELDEWDDVKEQRVADGQATRRVEELDPKNAANSWLQRVGWARHLEGLQVIFRRIRVTLAELSGFMHAVLQEARSIMTELAMCGEGGIGESPAIAWNDVYDDNSNDSVGYSFIKDDRNTPWVVQGKGYIKRQLVRCNRQQKAWLRRVDAPGVGPAQGTPVQGEEREGVWPVVGPVPRKVVDFNAHGRRTAGARHGDINNPDGEDG
ncbi:hypothetical protein NHJ13734_009775 [Beauveria thailandica]